MNTVIRSNHYRERTKVSIGDAQAIDEILLCQTSILYPEIHPTTDAV
jgi:hypothetical protein